MDQEVATLNSVGVHKPTDAPEIRARKFRARGMALKQRHWVRGDPLATAFFNALSAVFPHGERFMIESLVPWQKKASGQLALDIAAFIEQEAGHSREHVVMNKALTDAGYDIAPLDKSIRSFVSFFSGASDVTKLGATMCIEHLTAIVSAELMVNPRHMQGSDPELHKLWLWHSVEEIEHKAVAFDAWMMATSHWSGTRRWLVRSSLCVAVTTSFFINRTRGQMELLRQDGFTGIRALIALLRFGFNKDGIGRAVLRPWAAFFKPGFHPWQIDDRSLIIKGEHLLAALKLVTEGEAKSPATDATPAKQALAA
jgi:predicted metal-dependent hydrolase